MKNLTRLAAFLVGAALASQSARATFTANDLYLGFQNSGGGGTADYIINLGSASSLINAPIQVNLTSDFSLADFQSAGLSGTNSGATIMGGVVGGSNGNSPSDIFLTELRVGGSGNMAVPGSTAPSGMTRSQDNTAYSVLSQIDAPAAGTGILDGGKSWENFVEPTFSSSSFYGDTGINPDHPVSQSTVLYEDLWETSDSSLSGSQPYTYEGYFTLDVTSSGPNLTFTPVPEPSSYLISGAGGIFLVLLRNRLRRRNA